MRWYAVQCLSNHEDKVRKYLTKYKEEDEAYMKKVGVMNQFEGTVYSVRSSIEDEKCTVSDDDKAKIKEKVEEMISWIDNNKTAEIDEIEAKSKEFMDACVPLYAEQAKAKQESEPKQPIIDEMD